MTSNLRQRVGADDPPQPDADEPDKHHRCPHGRLCRYCAFNRMAKTLSRNWKLALAVTVVFTLLEVLTEMLTGQSFLVMVLRIFVGATMPLWGLYNGLTKGSVTIVRFVFSLII